MLESGTQVETRIIKMSKKSLDAMPFSHLRKSARGRFEGFVPSTNGKIWWVKHFDGSLSSYLKEEVIVIQVEGVTSFKFD